MISESGAVASYGKQIKKGLELALEEINAAGGFKGGQITLIYRDDATNPAVGKQVVEKLISEDGVKVIIGAVSPGCTRWTSRNRVTRERVVASVAVVLLLGRAVPPAHLPGDRIGLDRQWLPAGGFVGGGLIPRGSPWSS